MRGRSRTSGPLEGGSRCERPNAFLVAVARAGASPSAPPFESAAAAQDTTHLLPPATRAGTAERGKRQSQIFMFCSYVKPIGSVDPTTVLIHETRPIAFP